MKTEYKDTIKSERKAVGCIIIILLISAIILSFGVKAIWERLFNEREHIQKTTLEVVQGLGEEGEICKVYGHRYANYDYDNRRCVICGEEEAK